MSKSQHKPLVGDDGFVAGNYYDKYGTSNPMARHLMQQFTNSVLELLQMVPAVTKIHEIGCGEGHFSSHFAGACKQLRSTDISSDCVELAKQKAKASGYSAEILTRDLHDMRVDEDKAELVVCCEVLEHVEGPESAVRKLAELADPYLIASVPREPLWRVLNCARGKYLSDLGNTPGHINHWSRAGFVSLLSAEFEIIEVRTPLPWTMVLAKVRADKR